MRSDKESDKAPEPVPRREDRNATNWIANVRLPDGREIPCTVKDVSKSGAKLGIPGYHALPESFLLRIIGRDFVCMVKLAWRRGDYVGVRIERVGKVAPPRVQVAAPEPVTTSSDRPPTIDEPGGVGIRSRRRKPTSF
ncbi:PilZ domain-containing protein [Methylobacterium sp. E-045]|uniref:PilZ domain-containing protein n=1 Tax=Methylobacterium sp. E-045 TaxID=2836575 RepID=UPI001FBBB42C|nr:PilZ domain-containing protein [Methylobacterium sp. E-045]MCJ2128710.1 PilZ domain-containing protein [Methylobacterium sp. E-045]